jgi:DNA-binding transcriptional LysR family regulator
MELRHLRCFLAVAEELHFARAAERLHIEQSPLSRAIKELEEELGARLFNRTTRSTRLTRAGQLFLKHVPRVFTALDQARGSVQAAAAGFHDQLRLALSDGITRPRLTALLAQCREEEPQVDIRLFEVPLGQQLRGLHEDLYDLGFAQSPEVGDGIVAMPAWSDPLVVAVPARHPLLAYQRIPLDEVLRHPLVACDPQSCEGHCHQIRRILRGADREPLVVEQVSSHDLMLTLVAAGYALALVGASHLAASRREEVVARPLAGRSQVLTTWLLRRDAEPSETLRRFIGRVTPISGDPTHEGDSFTSDTKGEN